MRVQNANAPSDLVFDAVSVAVTIVDMTHVESQIVGWQSAGLDVPAHLRNSGVVDDLCNRICVIDVNATAAHLFQCDRKQELIDRFASTLLPVSAAWRREYLTSFARNDDRFDKDTEHRTLDGQPLHLQLRSSLIREQDTVLAVWTLVDVNSDIMFQQLEKLQQDVAGHQAEFDARVQKQDRLASLGRLSGGIAHDLSNLLTVILTQAELVRAGASGETRDDCEQIVGAGRQAATLCRQLLTYADQSRSKMRPVDVREVDVREIVRETVAIVRAVSTRQIQFDVRLEHRLPYVSGDVGLLSRIVLNLVSNASESIGNASGVISISCEADELTEQRIARILHAGQVRPGRSVAVHVRDNGRGLDPDDMSHIFDAFFSTRPNGRGLGLTTVLGAVQQHKGALDVQSDPLDGTCFSVFLPAMGDRQPTDDVQTVMRPTSIVHKVAVIDDEPAVRNSIRKLLSLQNFDVEEFSSGEQAVAELQRVCDRDVVLLDLQLSGIDGMEAYRRIREACAEIPICFVSGCLVTDDVAAIIDFDPHTALLDKPFAAKTLIDTVRQLSRFGCLIPRQSGAG